MGIIRDKNLRLSFRNLICLFVSLEAQQEPDELVDMQPNYTDVAERYFYYKRRSNDAVFWEAISKYWSALKKHLLTEVQSSASGD